MKPKSLSVYVANLARRVERKLSIEAQFFGRKEFELTIVPAIEHENGVWGQWQTFYGIVKQEADKNSPYFVFCEDDHLFTENYDAELFLACVCEADALGADMLSGGMSWMRSPLQISDHLFHVDAFNGMQFVVIYRRFYSTILSYETPKGYVTDKFLSEVSNKIFVTYPFISVQGDFGYSDVTSQNNQAGRVPACFKNMSDWVHRLAKVRDFYRKMDVTQECPPIDIDGKSLSTYIIHLPEHVERKENIEQQFSGRSEFDVHWVDACRHTNGAIGLWNSICKIVAQASMQNEDVILICEDDHVFTPSYDAQRFLRQVWTAGMMGTEILLGGIGGFGDVVPVRNGLFWFDWAWCTQFTVIYKSAFPLILQAEFKQRDAADEFLSRLLSNKLAIFPFISEQKDFGYSDVTPSNNCKGRITEHFRNTRRKFERYTRTIAQYHLEEFVLPDEQTLQIERYLKHAPVKGLHLGCGPNLLEGWLNTDTHPIKGAIYLDAAHPFPLADGVLDYIFTEHMLEHLSYEDGKYMLQECFRTLKQGGILRVTLPTLDFLIKLYNEPEQDLHQRYASWSLRHYAPVMYADFAAGNKPFPMSLIVNNFMRFWGHQMLYDRRLLCEMLEKTGFRNIRIEESGVSKHPFLCKLEHHGTVIPDWANRLESITIEAEK